MPSIEISQRLFDFLTEEASKGHGGDIHDYLYSHFALRSIPETNPDRTILALLTDARFLLKMSVREQYLMILQQLCAVDETKFATLNGFRMPNSHVVLIANERSMIERTTTNRTIEAIAGSGFFALVAASRVEFQDQIFHLMRALHYPFPIAMAVKQSLRDLPINLHELGL